MKNKCNIFWVGFAVFFTAMFIGAAGEKNQGTARIYEATQSRVDAAITNAFIPPGRYHDLMLLSAGYKGLVAGWLPTNGLVLRLMDTSPLAMITNKSKVVPYYAAFHLTTKMLATNKCEISVRTIASRIHDGKEIGIHGGWANRSIQVPPVLQEETNVLLAIESELYAPTNATPVPETFIRR